MESAEEERASRWYVVHTHPRQEDRADYNLRAWNIETFSPKLRRCRPNSFTGEPVYIATPLFAGYIFARFDVGSLYNKIRFTRGVHSVVSFGGTAAPVEESIINVIRQKASKTGFVMIGEQFVPGDHLVVQAGPLKDFTGIFLAEMKESERVMILLDTVSYQARALVEREYLRKVG